MAASMLGTGTLLFFRAIKRVPSLKTLIPASSQCGSLLHIANYNARPLKLNIKDPYIPDKDNEKTPEWQKTAKYDRKLYGRYGSASGIDPATLWPTHAQLEEIIADENEWQPSLEVMQRNIAVKEKEIAAKRIAREKLIAANIAKMPKMIEDWRREKRESKVKVKEEKARRDRLLAEARERFGFAIDPRSSKFIQMVADIEKEEKKKRKLVKRQLKEEKVAAAAAPPSSPPSS